MTLRCVRQRRRDCSRRALPGSSRAHTVTMHPPPGVRIPGHGCVVLVVGGDVVVVVGGTVVVVVGGAVVVVVGGTVVVVVGGAVVVVVGALVVVVGGAVVVVVGAVVVVVVGGAVVVVVLVAVGTGSLDGTHSSHSGQKKKRQSNENCARKQTRSPVVPPVVTPGVCTAGTHSSDGPSTRRWSRPPTVTGLGGANCGEPGRYCTEKHESVASGWVLAC